MTSWRRSPARREPSARVVPWGACVLGLTLATVSTDGAVVIAHRAPGAERETQAASAAGAVMPGPAPAPQESETNVVEAPVSGPPRELMALAWDRDDSLWLACFYGGIYRFRDGKFTRFDAYNSPIPDSGASALCVDVNNVKWLGTPRGYVYSFDGKTWKVHAELRKVIERIRKDRQGRIWCAHTQHSLLYLPDEKAQEVTRLEFPARYPPVSRSPEEIRAMDVDAAGNVWVATTQGIAQYDGTRWTRPGEGKLDGRQAEDVWCDRRDGSVYFAVGNELHKYKAGKWTALIPPNPKKENWIGRICGSDQGLLGVLYNFSNGAAVLREGGWEFLGPGTPLENDHLTGIARDEKGRLWFIGRRGGLRSFDGAKWTTFPAVEYAFSPYLDPRLVWRRTYLNELIAEKEVEADIHEVLQNPRKYFGKKIRFLGTTESSFEYANFVDQDGKKLDMWPDLHRELYDFLRESGLQEQLKEVKLREFVGYLEFGGYYGHMGGWPRQFFLTEIYPASDGKLTKAEVKKKLLEHLERTRPDQWIAPLPEDEAIRKAKEALQGVWVLESEVDRGAKLRVTEGGKFVFRGDRLTIHDRGRTYSLGFCIDPFQDPPAIDFREPVDSPDQRPGGGSKAIYRIEGDRLTICRGDVEHRPRRFESAREPPTELLVFRRPGSNSQVPAQKAQPAPKREDGPKAQSAKNLKRLGRAMHNFQDRHRHFPPAVLDTPPDNPALNGGAPHSWRVALLPYLGHRDLYDQYHFDEPWDGPNNLKLLQKMPAVYRHPTAPPEASNTAYFVLTGPGTVHDGTDKPKIQDITDGTSNTLHIVETSRKVPWTKPEDIAYHPDKPLPELGGYYEGCFFVGLVDATPALIDKTVDEEALRHLIERADGAPFDWLPYVLGRW